jgi:hypothetical protein
VAAAAENAKAFRPADHTKAATSAGFALSFSRNDVDYVVFCFTKPEDAEGIPRADRRRGDHHGNEALIAVRQP